VAGEGVDGAARDAAEVAALAFTTVQSEKLNSFAWSRMGKGEEDIMTGSDFWRRGYISVGR
jgi:hypothetical protein